MTISPTSLTPEPEWLTAPFQVVGSPAAQGSKKHVGGGVMVEMAKGHKDWRAAVSTVAYDAHFAFGRLDGALLLEVEFRFPMPASRPKAVRAAGLALKTTAPDLDKLVRCVGDSLQAGGLVADDARFAKIVASKVEVIGWTGATIRIGRAS